MLSKSRRLSRSEFLIAKHQSLRLKSAHCSAQFHHSSSSKVAIVTSTKLSKKAVVRNHLRRQIYTIFMDINLPGDIILYPTASMLNLPYEELRTEINSLVSSLTSA